MGCKFCLCETAGFAAAALGKLAVPCPKLLLTITIGAHAKLKKPFAPLCAAWIVSSAVVSNVEAVPLAVFSKMVADPVAIPINPAITPIVAFETTAVRESLIQTMLMVCLGPKMGKR